MGIVKTIYACALETFDRVPIFCAFHPMCGKKGISILTSVNATLGSLALNLFPLVDSVS